MNELTDDQFFEALNNEDHLGMTVRAHIHIEHWVEKFITTSMPYYSEYKKDIKADYQTKIYLCCAMGLSPTLKPPLSAVGKIRNKFAHEPNFQLTEGVVNSIYESLATEHKEQLQLTYSKLATNFNRKEKKYSALPVELKLNLLFMFLRKKLIIANLQLKDIV